MAMAGCELNIVNSDQLNTTNMWVDESDVTGATTGIYFELRNAFRQNYTNQFFWGELRVGPAMGPRGYEPFADGLGHAGGIAQPAQRGHVVGKLDEPLHLYQPVQLGDKVRAVGRNV